MASSSLLESKFLDKLLITRLPPAEHGEKIQEVEKKLEAVEDSVYSDTPSGYDVKKFEHMINDTTYISDPRLIGDYKLVTVTLPDGSVKDKIFLRYLNNKNLEVTAACTPNYPYTIKPDLNDPKTWYWDPPGGINIDSLSQILNYVSYKDIIILEHFRSNKPNFDYMTKTKLDPPIPFNESLSIVEVLGYHLNDKNPINAKIYLVLNDGSEMLNLFQPTSSVDLTINPGLYNTYDPNPIIDYSTPTPLFGLRDRIIVIEDFYIDRDKLNYGLVDITDPTLPLITTMDALTNMADRTATPSSINYLLQWTFTYNDDQHHPYITCIRELKNSDHDTINQFLLSYSNYTLDSFQYFIDSFGMVKVDVRTIYGSEKSYKNFTAKSKTLPITSDNKTLEDIQRFEASEATILVNGERQKINKGNIKNEFISETSHLVYDSINIKSGGWTIFGSANPVSKFGLRDRVIVVEDFYIDRDKLNKGLDDIANPNLPKITTMDALTNMSDRTTDPSSINYLLQWTFSYNDNYDNPYITCVRILKNSDEETIRAFLNGYANFTLESFDYFAQAYAMVKVDIRMTYGSTHSYHLFSNLSKTLPITSDNKTLDDVQNHLTKKVTVQPGTIKHQFISETSSDIYKKSNSTNSGPWTA